MLEQGETNKSELKKIPVIAVTMATGRQGAGVVKELSQTNKYKIRAITRDLKSSKSQNVARFYF